ncbi:sulfatase-like hydrolase/transferase [Marinobacter sp. F4206]|uniref:sulfatase-like hydrolase/transferase n=1 Tax=Marinobacter sp. F4206 TaxID=2861777 RepID=UPI001C5FB435|nr:sulfatase-like hydrolase/transferase [Marinobacter sp. F4206]MBW4934973.1 sulfatase-like hydrolase/transferase [Marinobacter sp. F4206]
MADHSVGKAIGLGAVSVLLVAEFGMFSDFLYPFRLLWRQGQITELLLSVMVLLWSVAGVFLVFFSGRSLFRTITLPFFVFFFLSNIGSVLVSKAPIDFQQADLIVSYFQWWAGAVVENIGLAVLPLFIILVPLIILIERLPRLLKFTIPGKFYAVPVSVVLLVYIVLLTSDGIFDRYPSFFRVPALLMFAGQSDLYEGERLEVSYAGPLDSSVEKIVLIVDESIRADILGINGYKRETTPYLSSLDSGLVNFGLAASSSNCSDYSNLILRTGIRKEAIPDQDQTSLKTPSIWQFTRRAGYSNVYLDAQNAEAWANYQNFMNDHEATFIDELLRLRQNLTYESDGIARDTLIDLLEQSGKTFIMLNKHGIHFPYFRSYPEASTIFTPALEPGEPMNDREKSLNSYLNGLRWSVDDWFKGLLSESAEFRKYVIIYTSDHGQNIVDDGTLATHCRPRANRFEGIVPMMVFSNDPGTLARFRSAQSTGNDRTSHFQVFPTLLNLAGYNESWVSSHYGASLSEPSGALPEFFVGDAFGRGSVRRWHPIFPAENDGGQ